MSKPPKEPIWPAREHTLAKIAILDAYLNAWFAILGRSVKSDMLYIDGFSGPGVYAGGQDGSPIVAVKAAHKARCDAGEKWTAKTIRMVFVERDSERFDILQSRLAIHQRQPNLSIQCINKAFASAFDEIRRQHMDAFTSSMPLFAFLDPFGVKGTTFNILQEILSSGTSEVFLLFDADGMERIRVAGGAAGCEAVFGAVFGGPSWREISFTDDIKSNSRKILAAYREQLRGRAGAKFSFSFEMRKDNGASGYHLLFATKHIRGLEKMKEAMRAVDKNFIFADGQTGQKIMFGPDNNAVAAVDAETYFNKFCSGKRIRYGDIRSWVLQETPYMRPDTLLTEMSHRHGVDSVIIGGKVIAPGSKLVRWSETETITFRDRLAPRKKGLFDQE